MFYECAKKEQKALESSNLDDVADERLELIKNGIEGSTIFHENLISFRTYCVTS